MNKNLADLKTQIEALSEKERMHVLADIPIYVQYAFGKTLAIGFDRAAAEKTLASSGLDHACLRKGNVSLKFRKYECVATFDSAAEQEWDQDTIDDQRALEQALGMSLE